MRCARHSRLTGFYSTAVTFGGQYNYAFDPLDNLRSVQHVGGSTSTYLYDTNDRLTSINNTVNGSTAFSYDVQGNIAAKAGQTYSFDYGNRLREVPGKEDYRYDAWGRRQRADSPNLGEILWVYGREGKPVFMANRRVGGLQHVYLYLGSQLVATQLFDGATNPTVYQTTDVQGTVIAQTNSAAWVDHFQYYDPFGRLVAGQIDDAPAYAGQVSDQNTGLSYAQQRYYDPSVGRFMSMDPVDANTVTGSNFNRYAYANDNPYRFTDPDGRQNANDTVREKKRKDWERENAGSLAARMPGVTAFERGTSASGSASEMAGRAGQAADAIGSTFFGTAFNEMKRPNNPTRVMDKFAHQMFMTGATGDIVAAGGPYAVAIGITAAPALGDAAAAVSTTAGNVAMRYGPRAIMAGCLTAACGGEPQPEQYVQQRERLVQMVEGFEAEAKEVYKEVQTDLKQ